MTAVQIYELFHIYLHQKASCVRFWRHKSKFSIQKVNGEEKLFFDRKAVMKKSELRDVVRKEFKHCIGARKLKAPTKEEV